MTQHLQRVLITGGAGFIGSHLAEHLLEKAVSVLAVDNFDPFYDAKFKKENISLSLQNSRYQFAEADILDSGKMVSLMQSFKPQVVVHLAAKAGVRPSLQNPEHYVRTNIEGTVSLLNSMHKVGLNKIVFASSSSVYGRTSKVPFSEDATFDSQISPYAASKQAGELMTRLYHNLYNFDVINLRFFTVYGPRQRPDLAIHKFMKANLRGESIIQFGDGEMARDYTFVNDTVQGVIKSVERILEKNACYETYNLGNSSPVSLLELITAIEDVTGKKMIIKKEPVQDGDVPITFANISLAKNQLSYCPQTPLREGLKIFHQWLVTHGE